MKHLSPKERMFLAYVLADTDLGPQQAATRAGYSLSVARSHAFRWICKDKARCPKNKIHVWEAYHKALDERAQAVGVTAEKVLLRLEAKATADVRDLYNADGTFKSVHDWPLIWRQGLVAGIETQERVNDEGAVESAVIKVKLADRTKLEELVGRHVDVQAFKDRIGVTDDSDLAAKLRARREARLEAADK